MSLFENDRYEWRETYFVLFDAAKRPPAERVKRRLLALSPHYRLVDVRADEKGRFEFLTLLSPEDYAAMDITYLAGEEVTEHVAELAREMRPAATTDEEKARLEQLRRCNARFDIYHFEQIVSSVEEDEELMDPGLLLAVLEELTTMCDGIGIDPQSGSWS